MNLETVLKIVQGKILTSEIDLALEIESCGASDLLSDALTFMRPGSLLLTGLVHPQVIRTAEIADLAAIVFVRGKMPRSDTVELAKELDVPIIGLPLGTYKACGRLYHAGLEPVMKNDH